MRDVFGLWTKSEIFTVTRGELWLWNNHMFTGMLVAASFLITGLIAFTYLKNG